MRIVHLIIFLSVLSIQLCLVLSTNDRWTDPHGKEFRLNSDGYWMPIDPADSLPPVVGTFTFILIFHPLICLIQGLEHEFWPFGF
jgi:hypothetical protein